MASRNVSLIPSHVRERILSFAHQADLDHLRYVQVPFFGYDDEPHQGELVVHKAVATEVHAIFTELFNAKFPIEKMHLIETYDANDNASMADNNSSAFCHRFAVAKPGILSKHALGLAIDINPLYNPYVKKDLILPPQGKLYLDRTQSVKGMISENSLCYHAFVSRGWTWGGSWPDRQDYQHFEKKL